MPGVSRPLPRICENVPSEQKLSLYEVYSNLGKFILAELALKAQTTSMLSFLVDSVVDPCTKKERPFGIGIDLPDGHHLDDESFARQRFSGANPMSTARCDNLIHLREILENAKLNQIQIEDIITECTSLMIKEGKNLFLMDYLFLEPFVNEPTVIEGELKGHLPATLSIFYMDDSKDELVQIF